MEKNPNQDNYEEGNMTALASFNSMRKILEVNHDDVDMLQ